MARALEREQLLVSAVSFYEIAQLIDLGRLPAHASASSIRERALNDGVTEITICGAQAIDAAGLTTLPGDPMDRFIVAAARHARAQLITADIALLAWKGDVKRLDATE